MVSSPSHTETDPARGARSPIVIEDDLPGGGDEHDSSLPELDPDAYHLMDEIARGGMGRILRARDRLGRIVAVKQLLDPSPHHIALFEREARITARLQHPSIVSVIEAGVLPDGQRVYVMQLVPGHSLKQELRKPKDVLERLRLLPIIIAIADALAYAHAQGVIHRDLKPSNILIGEFGEVVVIDWGLAHDPQTRGPSSPDGEALDGHSTITAKAMGTPAYMSPEAARSESVDQRTDVYAIGTILYELLSGAAPYAGDGAGILGAVRAGPPEPIARRVPGTPPDLAAIVDKAMAFDRAARYPSAKELAEELRRFATGQFVSAYAYSLRDRFARWLRRNRAPVAVAAAAFAIVTTLVAIGVTRIVHERDVAADRAERLTLARARLELDRDPAGALDTLMELPPGSPSWSAARTIAADALARGVPNHARFDRPVDGLAMARSMRVVVRQDDAIEVVEGTEKGPRNIARIAARASAVALSADGESVAAIDDGHVRVWRVAAPAKPAFERAGPRLQSLIAISPDGGFVAVAGRDTGLTAWRIADGEELVRNDQLRDVASLAASGVAVAAIDARGTLTLASPTTGITAGTARNVAVHDQLAIATTPDGTLRIFDPVSFRERRSVALGASPTAIAISPTGTRIAIAGETGIAVFDADGTRLRSTAARHRPRGVAVDDAGSVAIFEREKTWWWSADSNLERLTTTSTSAFAVAGDRAVSIGDDGAVWTWRLGGTPVRIGAHTAAARAVAIAPDGSYAVTIGDDRAVRRWSLDNAAKSELLGVHHGPGLAIAIGANGAVASGGGDRLVHLWRAGKDSVLGRHAGAVHSVAFSPDGTQLASGGDDREVIVWSLANRSPRRFVHASPVTAIAWLTDGALVVGARDGTVTWWSPTADGTIGGSRILATHSGPVRSLATSGDDRIASGGDNGSLRIGTPTGLEPHPGHGDLIRRLAFGPDGAVLASASEDGTVRLWDPATGESRAIVMGGWLADVAFVGGGTCLAAGANGLWSIADGLPHDRDALRAVIGKRVDRAR